MSMKCVMDYKSVKIVCSKCNEELNARFIEQGTFYVCSCGKTEVTSDFYHKYKDHEQYKVKQAEVDALVKGMSAMINSFNTDKIGMFVQGMACEHRTLQQSFTGLCMQWMKYLAECDNTGRYDGRNEASVKLAKEIFEKIDNTYLPMV